jgi:hypothetical protein
MQDGPAVRHRDAEPRHPVPLLPFHDETKRHGATLAPLH